jgi:hypothetical protein
MISRVYRENNREAYNRKRREYRARKKEEKRLAALAELARNPPPPPPPPKWSWVEFARQERLKKEMEGKEKENE